MTDVTGVRIFGWAMLALMCAFLVNVVLTIAFDLQGAGYSGIGPILQSLIYVVAIGLTYVLVQRTPHRGLREDSKKMSDIAAWLIRGAFWAVLFVGIADSVISFLRVELMLEGIFGEETARALGRSNWRGPNVHMPLIALGFIVGSFTRTLGFVWLSLLIVLAELMIVISRFVFSYEQAFMGDLVRYWYAALFLFASAYTLLEEGHVRVDVFYAGFGPTTKGMVNAWGSVLLGMSMCWTILIIGMGSKTAIITSPVLSFESTQSGVGLYVKYQMAAFLGLFAISMMIQFCSYLLESVADWRKDPGGREHDGAPAH